MKLTPLDPPRRFAVGPAGQTIISDCGRLQLAPDEQVTLVTESGSEHDVTRKSWGFYATASTNSRLPAHGLRPVLVRNPADRYFVFLVERGRETEFHAYLAGEQQQIVLWLDGSQDLRFLEQLHG